MTFFKFQLDLYFMMLYPSLTLKRIDASVQNLLRANQKCDAAAAEYTDDVEGDRDMIPVCLPYFAGNTKNDMGICFLLLW